MSQSTGCLLYQGPSVLDPSRDIICILTFRSTNRKTGDIPQTWIMDASMEPHIAVKTGDDASVCGSCVHRPSTGGACYVSTFQAPLMIYRGWMEDRYPDATPMLLKRIDGQTIRLGAYGDPAAVPYDVWENLLKYSGSSLGYTHQALHPNFDYRILRHCMVSADSPQDAVVFRDAGLRTFRVKQPEEPLLSFEIECLADSTPGMTCQLCKRCNGAEHQGKSIAIDVHGSKKKRFEPIQVLEVS